MIYGERIRLRAIERTDLSLFYGMNWLTILNFGGSHGPPTFLDGRRRNLV